MQSDCFSGAGCHPTEKPGTEFQGYGFDRPEEKFDVVSCPTCQLSWVHPPLGPEELKKYYEPSYYGTYEAKFSGPIEALTEVSNKLRAGELLRYLPKNRANNVGVLDVGCGRGNFLKFLARQGIRSYGTELPGFQFGPAPEGVEFRHGDFGQAGFQDESMNAVTIWHVLEHMTDPAGALQAAQRLLKPKGVLAIAVPNYGSYQSRLFGKHWFHLDLPRHLFHFTQGTLFGMLNRAGFAVVHSHTHNKLK